MKELSPKLKALVRSLATVMVIFSGIIMLYFYVVLINFGPLTSDYYPFNYSLDIPPGLTVTLVLLISLLPLKYVSVKKWGNGINEIGLFLLNLPVIVAVLLSTLLSALTKNITPFRADVTLIATFFVVFIISYLRIITYFKTKQ